MEQRLRILAMTTLVLPLMFSGAALAQQEQKPSIAAFINHIWQASPAIHEAEARVAAAQAGQRAASRWQYNPELEFEVEDVDGEDKTMLLGVSQTIDWSGKFRSSGKTAEFELLAASAERDRTRQNIALGVLSALADIRAAKDIFGLAAQRSSLMKRFAGLVEKGFKAGDIDQSEYNLAQLALSEALIEQADAGTTLAESRQGLDTAIGFPLENGFALPDLPGTLPEFSDSGESEDDNLMNLPAIRAMKSREEAAKSIITQANKDRFPDPTISIVGGEDAGAGKIGFSVSVPLYVFKTYRAEVDVAKQEAIAEAKAGQNAFHAAKARLLASRSAYQLSRRAWENWQENGAQALTEQFNILDLKFKVGDLSATDYLVQIEQALDTEGAAKELHSKVWQSWFSWLAASGKTEQWIQNSGQQQ